MTPSTAENAPEVVEAGQTGAVEAAASLGGVPASDESVGDSGDSVGDSESAADLSRLPNYSRSLLKIRVPISVRLASKKELVQDVISLAPGSIIKFEKGCEELLQMMVGEHAVAEGEAVKVGEKFGFRVTSMLMPQEHFVPAKRVRRA